MLQHRRGGGNYRRDTGRRCRRSSPCSKGGPQDAWEQWSGRPPLHKKTKPHNLRSYESSKQSSTRIASALSCLNRSSSKTSHTRLAEVSAYGLERYTGRSLETGNLSSPSAVSLERARTSWRQRCYYAICPNHRTLKHGAFETRCRLCFKWRQFSKPRARPLDVEEQLQRSAMSRPRTKRRCRSISSHPLEGKR